VFLSIFNIKPIIYYKELVLLKIIFYFFTLSARLGMHYTSFLLCIKRIIHAKPPPKKINDHSGIGTVFTEGGDGGGGGGGGGVVSSTNVKLADIEPSKLAVSVLSGLVKL
jgi:hypothetical protein